MINLQKVMSNQPENADIYERKCILIKPPLYKFYQIVTCQFLLLRKCQLDWNFSFEIVWNLNFSNQSSIFLKVYLGNCSIKYVGPQSFASLALMIELDLSHNQVHTPLNIHVDTKYKNCFVNGFIAPFKLFIFAMKVVFIFGL